MVRAIQTALATLGFVTSVLSAISLLQRLMSIGLQSILQDLVTFYRTLSDATLGRLLELIPLQINWPANYLDLFVLSALLTSLYARSVFWAHTDGVDVLKGSHPLARWFAIPVALPIWLFFAAASSCSARP